MALIIPNFIAPVFAGAILFYMNQRFTLKKGERLKSRKQIESLFHSGKSFMQFPFKVYFKLTAAPRPPGANSLQFGIGVGARNFKKATDRNRIKRLSREAYRLQKGELQKRMQASGQQLALFFIYTGKELPDQAFVTGKIQLILERLTKMTNENSAAHT